MFIFIIFLLLSCTRSHFSPSVCHTACPGGTYIIAFYVGACVLHLVAIPLVWFAKWLCVKVSSGKPDYCAGNI